MNIKEFNVTDKPFKTTLMFELYEGSEFDKKTYKLLKKEKGLFADGKFDNEVFCYDITNKMSLRKYMSMGLDQQKLLYLVERLVDVELCFKELGVNPSYIMYDADLVLVDKDTEEISFVYVPASDHGLRYRPLKPFLKEILANAIYDEMENLDYVGRLITYINKNKVLNVEELMSAVHEIRDNQKNLRKITEQGAVEMAKEVVAGHMVLDDVVKHVADTKEDVLESNALNEPVPVELPQEEDIVSVLEPDVRLEKDSFSFSIEEPVVEETPEMKAVAEAAAAAVILDIPNTFEEPKETVKEDEELDLSKLFDEIDEPQRASEPEPIEEALKEPEAVELEDAIKAPEFVEMESTKENINNSETATVVEDMPIAKQMYPYLVRVKTQEMILIDKDEFKLGKIHGADYLLSDNPAVSRMHAIIHNVDHTYYICDNYSTNATYLNGERLEPGKNYLLMNGVKVRLANEEFTYICEE